MVEFGTGGWRAIIGDQFTRANIRIVAAALARRMKEEGSAEQGIAIGYDRRFLSRESAIWFSEVMAGEGVFVRFVNLSCPTPLVMFTVKNLDLPPATIPPSTTASSSSPGAAGTRTKPLRTKSPPRPTP